VKEIEMNKRLITQKAFKANTIPGFDCTFTAKPEDMAGSMHPFRPHWSAQYLGNGAWEIFDTPKGGVEWIKEYISV
jgi:hypothetical protein